jgi:HPt (histidine-containing phosphotransfer) domain-containing protein
MERLDQRMPDTAARGAAVDRSQLRVLSHSKANLEHDLIALFRRLNDEDLESLRQALGAGDFVAAARASHRISGASGMIGAAALADACQALEAACLAGDRESTSAHMSSLQQEVERVYAFLETL